VFNPNFEDKKYICFDRTNIAKITANSHELHSETKHWETPKHHGKKECMIFVTPRGLKMKKTLS
jgi:hypothetical protein